MCLDTIASNGWTNVPADAGLLFRNNSGVTEAVPLPLVDIPFPLDNDIVAKVYRYAEEKLHRETLNHSMRVYYYGAYDRTDLPCPIR
jgi:cyanamide hydratase